LTLPVECRTVDEPISDHCSGRSGGVTGQTHALQQNEFLSFFILLLDTLLLLPLGNYFSFFFFTLSRNKTEMWDTGFFSFSIITWFSVNLIKVLPGRYYNTVKET